MQLQADIPEQIKSLARFWVGLSCLASERFSQTTRADPRCKVATLFSSKPWTLNEVKNILENADEAEEIGYVRRELTGEIVGRAMSSDGVERCLEAMQDSCDHCSLLEPQQQEERRKASAHSICESLQQIKHAAQAVLDPGFISTTDETSNPTSTSRHPHAASTLDPGWLRETFLAANRFALALEIEACDEEERTDFFVSRLSVRSSGGMGQYFGINRNLAGVLW